MLLGLKDGGWHPTHLMPQQPGPAGSWNSGRCLWESRSVDPGVVQPSQGRGLTPLCHSYPIKALPRSFKRENSILGGH